MSDHNHPSHDEHAGHSHDEHEHDHDHDAHSHDEHAGHSRDEHEHDHDHEDHDHDGHPHGDHDHAGGLRSLFGELFHSHSHSGPRTDTALESSERGIWALKISLIGLFLTALFQVVIAVISGSAGLLGWSESKIIVRFWIASLIFALFALTTLKLR